MKTWTHVQRFIDNRDLPYSVDGETLKNLRGSPIACSVQAARDYFASPGHPDSKRTGSRKRRDLARYGSRVFKSYQGAFTPLMVQGEQIARTQLGTARLLGFISRPGDLTEYKGCKRCGSFNPLL